MNIGGNMNIRVGKKVKAPSLSRQIKNNFDIGENVIITAMGSQAVTTTLKAFAILNNKQSSEYKYSFFPTYTDLVIDNKNVKAMKFRCFRSKYDISISEKIMNKLNDYINSQEEADE